MQDSKRQAEFDELYKKGTPVRLRVKIGGHNLIEALDGKNPRSFKAGQVFLHPAPKRAQYLLDLGVVEKTELPTDAEKTQLEKTKKVAAVLQDKDLMDAAAKLLKERQDRLAKVEGALRKMPAEVLKSEVERRKLEGVADNQDARIAACLKDEQEKIEAGI